MENDNNQFFPGPSNATFAQMDEGTGSATNKKDKRSIYQSVFAILFVVLLACIAFWAGWIVQQELGEMEDEILTDTPKATQENPIVSETDDLDAEVASYTNFDEVACGISVQLPVQENYDGVAFDTLADDVTTIKNLDKLWVYTIQTDGTVSFHYTPGGATGYPSEAGALGDTVFNINCKDSTATLDEAHTARKAEVEAFPEGSYGEGVATTVAGVDAYKSTYTSIISEDIEYIMVTGGKEIRIGVYGEKDQTLITLFLSYISLL